MRTSFALAACIVVFAAIWLVTAQNSGAPVTTTPPTVVQQGQAQKGQDKAPRDESSAGQATSRGSTDPITTTTGGAPAATPEGDTPPGMQTKPEGSPEKAVPGTR